MLFVAFFHAFLVQVCFVVSRVSSWSPRSCLGGSSRSGLLGLLGLGLLVALTVVRALLALGAGLRVAVLLGGLPLSVPVARTSVAATASTTASATATTTTITAATTTATTATASTTAARLEVVTARLPVVAAVPVGPLAAARRRAGVDATLLDVIVLLVDVLLLAHDRELIVVKFGLGVKLKEGLGALFGLELGEDGALEEAVVGAAQTDGGDRAVGLEELLNLELGLLGLVAEALDVDAALHVVGAGDLLVLLGVVAVLVGEGNLAGDLIGLVQVEEFGVGDGLADGRVGLEVAHALEVVDGLERDGLVLLAAGELEQVGVNGQVGVGEVEVDLAADLASIVGLGQVLEARLVLALLAALVVGVALVVASVLVTATLVVAAALERSTALALVVLLGLAVGVLDGLGAGGLGRLLRGSLSRLLSGCLGRLLGGGLGGPLSGGLGDLGLLLGDLLGRLVL
jgi:hypothetical protein